MCQLDHVSTYFQGKILLIWNDILIFCWYSWKNKVACVCGIWEMQKIFWKHLPFHGFADTLNELITYNLLVFISDINTSFAD